METKEHIQGLKNNMLGSMAQLVCRIEYVKERIDQADEETAADLRVELDKFKDQLTDLKEEYSGYMKYLDENEQHLINVIEETENEVK